MKHYILAIFTFVIISCKQYSNENKVVGLTQVETNIPANVDSDFRLFLDFFNKDSIFQLNRIDFPIKVKDFQKVEFELNERVINKIDYSLKTFQINKTSDLEDFGEYEQIIKIENEKAIIEISGIGNGIAIDYEFAKVNGKWKLITWTDQST
ncbi:DUF4348 domain-containing protein [Mangrovimonas sp. YM274]|uniref:DUF4348 domain-containing protein n=1 Tax=Mangrovimonas sp. YM274 TaxID=3070660 RepID=UPI0027DAF7D3|nr:DUF4348 domain-containing protein [Mangrovimonas sp. YM274]WMI68201.1 DUF4348 domain-containing protein [Mangrovimonas sp. YM274]